MDSNALEREKGITILAKNTAITYSGVKINIIDTPGHADFSGEVERVINMADGCLLLVDAVEGPMPQTTLRAAPGAREGPQAHRGHQQDRPRERPHRRGAQPDPGPFPGAGHRRRPARFPGALRQRQGRVRASPTRQRRARTSARSLNAILEKMPPPSIEDGPFQMLVSNLDYDSHKGRIAIGRIWRGSVRPHDSVVGHRRRRAPTQLRDRRGLHLHGAEAASRWTKPRPATSWR